MSRDRELMGCLGLRLTSESFPRLYSCLTRHLSPACRGAALQRTLENLYGLLLSQNQLTELCWLLAGNTEQLRAGQALSFWSSQPVAEWAPFFVEQVQRRYDLRKKTSVYWVTSRIWGGRAATRSISRRWSPAFCRLLARRMGFTSSRGEHPFRDPRQLSGLLFLGLLEPKECLTGPRYSKVEVSGSFRKHNTTILRMRSRVRPYVRGNRHPYRCPMSYPTSVLCHLCPVGLDRCQAACHQLTFVKEICSLCSVEQWCDPLDNQPGVPVVCCVCRAKEKVF